MGLHEEIFEQPDVIARLLKTEWDHVTRIANEIKRSSIHWVFLAARGTSDNAGIYAKYLFGIHNQIPIGLAAPSIFGDYHSQVNLEHALVLGISQSGRSPDIAGVLEAGRKQGQPTLAITNSPESPLSKWADFVVDIRAGEEKSVAATKSYTAQLMAIAMLSTALATDKKRKDDLEQVPAYVEQVLAEEKIIIEAAKAFSSMKQCVILGRGFNYATAYEWALKLKELAYLIAEPYSSADFLHGPIAIVEKGFPVLTVMPKGAVFPEMLALVKRLKQDNRATLLVLSNHVDALSIDTAHIPLSEDMPEWISPIVSVVAAQLFSYWVTIFKGLDPEKPRGLTKVTETK